MLRSLRPAAQGLFWPDAVRTCRNPGQLEVRLRRSDGRVDPQRDPKLVKHIPGANNTWNIQVTLHDNLMLTALQKSVPAWGGAVGTYFGM